jgi:hypothetical protein
MSIKLNSALGGSVTLNEPATASAFTLTLPTDNIQPGMNLITPTSVVGGTFNGGNISFSAASSVSVNGCFTSSYQNYQIVININAISATGDVGLHMRMRSAGVDLSSASYRSQRLYQVSTSIGGLENSFAGDNTRMCIGQVWSGQPTASAVILNLINPQTAAWTIATGFSPVYASDSNLYNTLVTAAAFNTNSYDSLTFLASTGTITGTIRIYGMRNQ